jgi:hypothetical protein
MKKKNENKNPADPSTQRKGKKKNENDAAHVVKDVNQENDSKEFPGYPHYPPKEDILHPINDIEKAEVDVEDLSPLGKASQEPESKSGSVSDDPIEEPVPVDLKEEDIEGSPQSEADVTEEDLSLLGSDELNADLGDDEELKKRVYRVDMAAEDLDVPGAELDDKNEELGEEDEENNPYSLGGDRHEDLEEENDPGR